MALFDALFASGSFPTLVRTEASAMFDLNLVWAYVDPVTVLPATSIIATLVGVIVLFGKSILRAVVRWARLARLQWRGATGLRGTHFELQRRRAGESEAGTARRHGIGHEK